MDPQTVHVVGVVAVWVIFLSSIRFAAAGFRGLFPVAWALWRLWRSPPPLHPQRKRDLIAEKDRLYNESLIAITTPWSVTLLFSGVACVGLGLSFASAGDVVQLVSDRPSLLNLFDRGMDCLAAVLICAGMAFILAALSKRRLLSTAISFGFVVTGFGVGLVTVAHP